MIVINKDKANSIDARVEQNKMQSELEWCDLMLKYIDSGDTDRSNGITKVKVNNYAIKCRNYVTSMGGVLSVVGNSPARPVS